MLVVPLSYPTASCPDFAHAVPSAWNASPSAFLLCLVLGAFPLGNLLGPKRTSLLCVSINPGLPWLLSQIKVSGGQSLDLIYLCIPKVLSLALSRSSVHVQEIELSLPRSLPLEG